MSHYIYLAYNVQANSQTPTCTVIPLASLLIRLGWFLDVLVPQNGTPMLHIIQEVMPLLSFEVRFSTQEEASCEYDNAMGSSRS